LLTVLFVRFMVRGDIGHGLPSVLLAISRKGSKLPAKNMYSSLIASTLTVAFGGSVGLEAPIASTGSAIGSNIGRWFRLSPKSVRILLGCGAAGAIAGIFKAPFAGIMFVLEVFLFDLTATTALPLLLSALTAASVTYFLMGTEVQFHFEVTHPFGLSQLPYYVMLGVFCALVSVYFLRTTDRGQMSVNISHPGIVKGQHWHDSKNEKFLVVKGKGLIRFRKIGCEEIYDYHVNGEELTVVDIPTGYVHCIVNEGDEDMVTLMWASEPFDPEKPDTYREEV
jgi:H+/Cl- antiporter ClcA